MSISGGQHFIVCKRCPKNAEYFCNMCAEKLCEDCKRRHEREFSSHKVVIYRERQVRSKSALEACKSYPGYFYESCCQRCEVPICDMCIREKQYDHPFVETEKVYKSKLCEYNEIRLNIQENILPKCSALLGDVKFDLMLTDKTIPKIRSKLNSKAKIIKDIVDDILKEKLKKLDRIETSLISALEHQKRVLKDHTDYLHGIALQLEKAKTDPNKPAEFILYFNDITINNINRIPTTDKINMPSFTDSKATREDVMKLFGDLSESTANPQTINVRSDKRGSTGTEIVKNEGIKQCSTVIEIAKTLSPSTSLLTSITVPKIGGCCHISFVKSNLVWISDADGNMILTDINGKIQQTIKTDGIFGYHATTDQGTLFFTDKATKCVYKMEPSKQHKPFIETGEWEPWSVYSSKLNGQILVGMGNGEDNKVVRYDKTGKEIAQIQNDDEGKPLFTIPSYVTENINEYVIVSGNGGLVAVDGSGKRRFTYGNIAYSFLGVCTDDLGHIITSEIKERQLHILDQNGHFLSFLKTRNDGMESPNGLCVDDQYNLFVGYPNNKLKIFKYLQ